MGKNINLVQTGLIWAKMTDITISIVDRIKSIYTYPHPLEDDKAFSTFVETEDKIGVPSGDMEKVFSIFPTNTIKDLRIAPKCGSPIKFIGPPLRDYQVSADIEIQKYIKEGGTTWNLAGSPGSGKSFMLAYLLKQMNIKTLVIAHLSMLTDQLYTELNDNLDADIRILNAKQLELGDISVATSQFISKRPELWDKIKHNIGFIVVDESESAASETTLRILQRAHAKYRMFISATFSRSVDNRTEALKDLAGFKRVELKRLDLLKPSIIGVTCPEIFIAPQHKHLYKRFQTAFYNRFVTIDDKIIKIVQSALSKNRQVLIVTDIISMQERYAKALKNVLGIEAGILNGTVKTKDRKLILKQFDDEEIPVLIGAAVLNAGLSIPKISVIIRVSFANSHEKLIQLIGRALRDYEGKQGAWFIDLQFAQGVYKRELLYAQQGYKYMKLSWEDFRRSL